MKLTAFVLGFFLLGMFHVKAQDIHFSQYDVHALYLGPQNSGLSEGIRAGTNYRKQWSSLSPFQTIAASIDGAFEVGRSGNKMGLGLLFAQDDAGTVGFKTSGINLSMSYLLKTSDKSFLTFGIGAGFFQNSVDPTKFQWESQFIDNSYQNGVNAGEVGFIESDMTPDLNAGISYYIYEGNGRRITRNSYGKKKMLFGATVSHLLAPQVGISASDDKMLRKYTLYSQLTLPVNNYFLLEPMVLGMLQGRATTFVIGTNYLFVTAQNSQYTRHSQSRAFGLSTHYRFGDALILGMFFDWNKLRVKATYDFNLSGLTKATNTLGAYELSLTYEFSLAKHSRYHKLR